MANRYEYHDLYKKYDMTPDEIHIGTGIVKVHDIFNPLPEFMHKADCIFCDPPCNRGNLRSFYTKAELDQSGKEEYADFRDRLFACVDEVNPKMLVLETFKANHEACLAEVTKRYPHIKVYSSMYYRNPKNHCNIIVASKEEIDSSFDAINGMDEEAVIEWLCENAKFDCIGDFCMGKGLVGFYANKHGRPFVGTELNYKRLAVMMERITTGKRGAIN